MTKQKYATLLFTYSIIYLFFTVHIVTHALQTIVLFSLTGKSLLFDLTMCTAWINGGTSSHVQKHTIVYMPSQQALAVIFAEEYQFHCTTTCTSAIIVLLPHTMCTQIYDITIACSDFSIICF